MSLQKVITIIILTIAVPTLIYYMAQYYTWVVAILLAVWIAIVNHKIIKRDGNPHSSNLSDLS
jgi:uncharacterized membrane protein YdbT with pleckstrin-like domain